MWEGVLIQTKEFMVVKYFYTFIPVNRSLTESTYWGNINNGLIREVKIYSLSFLGSYSDV